MESMFEGQIENLIKVLEQKLQSSINKEWLTLKEGSIYAGVSYNTFIKFRKMGLKICEIDGIKRVKKSEIDNFMQKNSY